jgi:hypothetical protein
MAIRFCRRSACGLLQIWHLEPQHSSTKSSQASGGAECRPCRRPRPAISARPRPAFWAVAETLVADGIALLILGGIFTVPSGWAIFTAGRLAWEAETDPENM